jgi:Zn-dependent protease with chaperone function
MSDVADRPSYRVSAVTLVWRGAIVIAFLGYAAWAYWTDRERFLRQLMTPVGFILTPLVCWVGYRLLRSAWSRAHRRDARPRESEQRGPDK